MPFDPVRVATTSLAGKSETEVVFMSFRPVRAAATSLACTEVGFVSFRPLSRSRRRHLPRMQERVGGGFYVVSTPFMLLPPPSHAKARRGWFYGLSTPFVLPPPPSHATAKRRWGFMAFRPRSRRHLPRRQERDGGGFYVVSTPFALPPPPSHATARRKWVYVVLTPFASPPPPSHARARRRWIFMSFRPRSRRRHLPHMQERVGGGFLGGFDPVRAAATSLTYNSESDVGFHGLSTPFAPLLPGFFLMHSVVIGAFRATTTGCLSGTAR